MNYENTIKERNQKIIDETQENFDVIMRKFKDGKLLCEETIEYLSMELNMARFKLSNRRTL